MVKHNKLKKMVALLLTIVIICGDTGLLGLLSIEADAAIDTSGYESKYGISYENLFKICPTYLDNDFIENNLMGRMINCAGKASLLAQQELSDAEFIHMLDKGVAGVIDRILGETGITETEYEEYRYDVAFSILRDYYKTESATVEVAKKIDKSVSKIEEIVDFVSDIEKFALLWSGEFDGCGNYAQVEEMVGKMMKTKKISSFAEDTEKVFNVVVELMILQEYQYKAIDVLIEAIEKVDGDSEIAKALRAIKNDIELDPVAYMMKTFVNDEIIDKIVKDVSKKIVGGIVGNKAAIAISIAKDVLVFAYEKINMSYEEIQKIFIAATLFNETQSCVNKYKKKFKNRKYTDRDVVLYEVAYNLQLSALKIYMEAGLKCVKKSDEDSKKLKFDLESFSAFIGDKLTYEAYIEACLSNVKTDIDAGILNIEDEIAKTPASEEGYNSYESIKAKFATIQSQFVPNAGATWYGNWEGAIQCFGFARMVFYYLYGCQMSYHYDYYERYRYTDETNVDLVAQVAGNNVTVDSVKATLSQGKLGDVIQASGSLYGQHTMIFVSADDNGVTVYDCNAKLSANESDCTIHQWTINWNTWVRYYGTGNSSIANGISLYRASNYASIYGDGDGMFYDDSVNFVIEDGVLTKYNGWQTFVSIPDTVTAIGDSAFKNNTTIRSVEIPDTVESIGACAFEGCSNLLGALIPDSVESIGGSAFYNCTSLNKVVLPVNEKFEEISSHLFYNCKSLREVFIPNSIVKIGTYAYEKCVMVTEVNIPNSVEEIGDGAFYECTNLATVKLSKCVKSIGYNAFAYCEKIIEIEIPRSLDWCGYRWNDDGVFKGCSSLKNITFEEGTTEIASGLFFGCDSLEEITIPDTVTVIENAAFANCTLLGNVAIPDTVVRIDGSAFANCVSVTEIELPDSVEVIESYAFSGCTNVNNIKLSKKLESMGYNVFENCSKVTEIEIPRSLDWCNYEWNGSGVFKGCSSLKDITFEEGTTKIASGLFFECDSLEDITIPDTVTVIESVAFANCDSLSKVKIPDTVVKIGDLAFDNCISMVELELPDSVEVIEMGAFRGCTNLTSVKLSKCLVSMDVHAFANCSKIEEIEIPKSLEWCGYHWAGSSVFAGCNSLKKIKFEEGIEKIVGALFFACDGIEEVVIPNTVKIIEYSSFEKCQNLKRVVIPEGLEVMEDSVFRECNSLEKIYIPDSVTSIGYAIFEDCTRLKEVRLSNNIKNIPSNSFYNCKLLESIELPEKLEGIEYQAFLNCKLLKDIVIPEGVKHIEASAFESCESMLVAILPSTLTTIGTSVFKDCIKLKDVDLGSGLTEIPSNTFYGCTLLPSIVIPENVTSIGDRAFVNCVKLKNIAIPETVTSIADNAFSYPRKLLIHGVEGSYVEGYAEEEGISFLVGDETRTSDDGVVIESNPWEVRYTLNVETKLLKETDEEYKDIDLTDKVADESIKAENVKFTAYDISLVGLDGENYQPKDEIKVKIPYKTGNISSCKVYYVAEDGTLTDMNATYEDGYVSFITDHFSTYLVTETELKTGTKTIYGDANGDGDVSGKDVVLIKKYLAGYENLSIDLSGCDVNADGDVSGKDVVKIMKYLAGYEVVLGEK